MFKRFVRRREMSNVFNHLDKRSSDRNQENRSINLSVFPFGRSESIDDGCRLFNDDDEDDDDDNGEDNLMLLGKTRYIIELVTI